MKSNDNFASERANDSELTNVNLVFVMPAVIMSTRFRAFVLKVPSMKRA
jgi:hypothetical protein